MIKLENIIKEYKMWKQTLRVLQWIDLNIEEGDFLSIMWPSGSGKSTLMNIIWLLDIPSSWKYILDDKRLDNLKENKLSKIRWKNIGIIFQSYNLISKQTAIKQVMLPLMYQWISRSQRIKRATQALDRVGLGDKLRHKPNELSWWQVQRISIARAIVVKPRLILADEPTWALDTVTWNEVMELLKELNEKEWKTIVLITHEDQIAAYAKKSILLKDGKIVDKL